MLQKPIQCRNCPLFNQGVGFSRPEGKCTNGVLIIGESLGSSEVSDALPFRPWAEAGSALQTAFRFLGLDRSQFGMWNLIGCQPPFNNLENAPYEEEAINHCKIHFNAVLNRFKPKVILALGNLPLKYLWNRDKAIDDYISQMPTETKEDRKAKTRYLKNFRIGSMRGFFLESYYNIPVIASWHPSYITRDKGRTQLGMLMRDINAALLMSRGQVPKFKSNYDENPTIEKAEDFLRLCKANPNLVIAHDIETPLTTLELDESEVEYENESVRDIDSIQFSVKEGTGIFIPYHGDYISIAKEILALSNPKIGWNNWKFDEVNLEYHHGKGSIAGENHDVMWMWKWLHQDFVKTGRALQFAASTPSPEFPAWKHLSPLSPQEYGCLDVDATLRIYNYLEKNFNNPQFRFKNPLTLQIETEHTKIVMQGYMDDVVHLRPILRGITDLGFPIDLKEREKFRQQIQEEQAKVLEDLQNQFPDSLRTIKPTLGYKFVPQEVFELTERFNKMQDFKNDGQFIIFDNEETGKTLLRKYIETHTRKFDEEEKEETTGLIVKEFTLEDGTKERRYCRMEKFKPGSPKQVISYIKFKGYKVPTKRDKIKGERDTSDKEHLKPLWEETGDDFLYNIIYIRELDNMLNTYVGTGTKGGWKIGSDNRVHAEFLFIPATGQLSTSPNIQNAPGHGSEFSSEGYLKLAQQFRRIVAAKSGHSLLSIDWSAFHINTLAFEACDADYMKIGRIDPHSFLASEILLTSLPMRLPKLIARKPSKLTDLEWKTRISLYEETLDKLKDFHQWLSYDEEKLKGILKWFKKYHKQLRDSQAKPAILGMGFGMKAGKFYQRNRSAFKSKAEPERIIDLMQGRFPKTFLEFPEKVKSLADNQTYLISRYGYIRRFFNVYDWRMIKRPRPPKGDEKVIRNSKGEYWLRKDGDSANECIAFLPANDAFGVKKEKMRELNYYERDGIVRNLNKEYNLINEIHDDLIFEVEDSKINEAAKLIQNVMESPAKYLVNSLCPMGLVTKTEIKVGKNWGAFEEKSNILGMKGLVV